MDSLDSNGILYTDSTYICAEDCMIEPRIPEKSLPTPRNALQHLWKRNLYDSALKCQRYVSSAFHFFENDRSQFRNVSGHFLIVLDLFPENCDIYHKNHDTYHKICIMKIVVHIQISRNRSKRKMKNRERIIHFDCFCVVKRPSWGAHVDPKSPLQKYITVVGKIYGGGSLVWVCSECQKKFKGSYTRVKEHLHMYKYDLKRDTRVTCKLLRRCVSL